MNCVELFEKTRTKDFCRVHFFNRSSNNTNVHNEEKGRNKETDLLTSRLRRRRHHHKEKAGSLRWALPAPARHHRLPPRLHREKSSEYTYVAREQCTFTFHAFPSFVVYWQPVIALKPGVSTCGPKSVAGHVANLYLLAALRPSTVRPLTVSCPTCPFPAALPSPSPARVVVGRDAATEEWLVAYHKWSQVVTSCQKRSRLKNKLSKVIRKQVVWSSPW